MSTESKRPRRQTGENRRRLLEAGVIEFGLHGFHGTSTAAIAARADVPQPHLYANFDSKQQLFLACVDIAVERALSADADPPLTDDSLRVLYQAFAAAGDPELTVPLSVSLNTLRDALGDDLLAAHLHRAAVSLL